ncbi:hypothetical protein PCANC_19956 [Puccinia coronata f. sp. avenae]|uniref:Uncharacterized protein n=1 Tax=Puccinia coronata f. sp. avenae TaxID=200324 RepID=A0A2N5VPV7_9BASI|nr:hypothetical protein PCANC_19956 [Puccinia coronata f. sp. avenae]PLW52012.1 hypothetical protein PCASD_02098 [Puccinia coronata f. sp. avenae]
MAGHGGPGISMVMAGHRGVDTSMTGHGGVDTLMDGHHGVDTSMTRSLAWYSYQLGEQVNRHAEAGPPARCIQNPSNILLEGPGPLALSGLTV